VHFAHLCIVNRTCALLSVPVYHFEGTTSTVVYKVEVTVDEEEDDDFPSRLIASQVATAAASSKERCYTYDKSCTYDTCPILRGCDQRETSSRDAMETWAWAGAVSCFSRPHLLSKTTFFFTLSLLFFSDEQNHPQSSKPSPKGLGACRKKYFQPCTPKHLFVWRAPIRCPAPEPVRATQGTLRGRWTHRKARREVAGPTRQLHIEF
jgi:hypothetical protein